MLSPSRFKNKVAVICGAEHPLAQSLALRLAGFGALVVAVGRSGKALIELAKTSPNAIEPLALPAGRQDIFALLQSAWEDQPIDLYFDISPLINCPLALVEAVPFSVTAGLARALNRGLRAGSARCVIAIPVATVSPKPQDVARAAGYVGLLGDIAKQGEPARFFGMKTPMDQDWTEQNCLSAGDAMLMLGHPVARGLKSGMVIEWLP